MGSNSGYPWWATRRASAFGWRGGVHGEDMWWACPHLDANHCSDAAVRKKIPDIVPLREELSKVYNMNKQPLSVEEPVVIKNGWILRKMVGFVKMKCRRDEVSIVIWQHCWLFFGYPRPPSVVPYIFWMLSNHFILSGLGCSHQGPGFSISLRCPRPRPTGQRSSAGMVLK